MELDNQMNLKTICGRRTAFLTVGMVKYILLKSFTGVSLSEIRDQTRCLTSMVH